MTGKSLSNSMAYYVSTWFVKDKYIMLNLYFNPDELVLHPAFQEHQLRITEPDLCDSSVKQYSGYLDIADDKHLFFWCVISHYSYGAWLPNNAICIPIPRFIYGIHCLYFFIPPGFSNLVPLRGMHH